MFQPILLKRPIKAKNRWALLVVLVLLCGCAGSEMAAGRQALLMSKPDVALKDFQRVAQTDPNYVMHFVVFDEGVWTYLGRAQYLAGKLPEARQSLEKAVAQHNDDPLARLYLGLALAREKDRAKGLKEIENGMTGIYNLIEFIVDRKVGAGKYWDPNREIRSEIQSDLAMIDGKEINWEKLISSCEWVGQKMEEEVDRATKDELNEKIDFDHGI